MNGNIIQIDEATWRIEDKGVRFFLLAGTEKALLIDSGMTIHNALEIASSLTDLPVSLLNTHADRDHIGSNSQFSSFYMHPDEEENYRRNEGTGMLLPIQEGYILDLGGRPLEIIHLPGHTPGSIAILDIRRRVLISGDPVQENGRIFMFGKHRNMKQYVRSLEKLSGLTERFDMLWPSHAAFPISPELISKLHDGALSILSGQVPGKAEEMFSNPIMAYDLGFDVLLCDPA